MKNLGQVNEIELAYQDSLSQYRNRKAAFERAQQETKRVVDVPVLKKQSQHLQDLNK